MEYINIMQLCQEDRGRLGVLFCTAVIGSCFGVRYIGRLQLELARDQGEELRIGGLALGIGHCIAEEPLQGVQVAPVPGNFNDVTDGPLHPAGGGAEGFHPKIHWVHLGKMINDKVFSP